MALHCELAGHQAKVAYRCGLNSKISKCLESLFWPRCIQDIRLKSLHACSTQSLLQSGHNPKVMCYLLCPGHPSFTSTGGVLSKFPNSPWWSEMNSKLCRFLRNLNPAIPHFSVNEDWQEQDEKLSLYILYGPSINYTKDTGLKKACRDLPEIASLL